MAWHPLCHFVATRAKDSPKMKPVRSASQSVPDTDRVILAGILRDHKEHRLQNG
jgi:hypothetical protein